MARTDTEEKEEGARAKLVAEGWNKEREVKAEGEGRSKGKDTSRIKSK